MRRFWRTGNEEMSEEGGQWTLYLEDQPVVFFCGSNLWAVKSWFTHHGLSVPPELFTTRPVPTPKVEHVGPDAWL